MYTDLAGQLSHAFAFLQRCETILTYCISDVNGQDDTHLARLTGLPLIVMADDSIATLTSTTETGGQTQNLYIMRSKEAAVLSSMSHRIIKWTVRPCLTSDINLKKTGVMTSLLCSAHSASLSLAISTL